MVAVRTPQRDDKNARTFTFRTGPTPRPTDTRTATSRDGEPSGDRLEDEQPDEGSPTNEEDFRDMLDQAFTQEFIGGSPNPSDPETAWGHSQIEPGVMVDNRGHILPWPRSPQIE